MKLLLLSDPNSPHTIKWATALAESGADIVIFGLGDMTVDNYRAHANIRVVTMNDSISRAEGSLKKLKYLRSLSRLKQVLREFQPDILHAHYASSYGLLGALSGFRPFVLSVWGADVFTFPKRSFIHKKMLEFNLSRAVKVLSTSEVMARETAQFTTQPIVVTPFGVDLDQFRPRQVKSPFAAGDIVVGTVKTLEEKYGIEYLVRAFHLVHTRQPQLPLKLLIVGGGALEGRLRDLVEELGLGERVVLTGRVRYDEVPNYHNMLSIAVSVSISDSESFGVAVIEAGACETPVVVSNVGGLPEVVEDGVTGIVVPPRDVVATAAAIEQLALKPALRAKMGRAGRERVQRLYDWHENVAQMIEIYREIDVSGAAADLAQPERRQIVVLRDDAA